MKTAVLLTLFFSIFSQAAEIVDVRNQIPMTNDAPRIKDYYLSTDGVNLKKDLVVKIVRTISVSQGKKSIGDVQVEVGQLRVLAVSDKVAVAREYKLFPKDLAPLTEALGFMVGDKVLMDGSFTDNTKRKPNGDESAHIEAAPMPVAPAATPNREPSAEQPVTSESHADSQKIEVKIFPDKI